ncbi:MAG: class I SAM-dependent methyltransferase [Candidatus Omnitrophota bacterium]
MYRYILKAYKKSNLGTRLHVFLRFKTCPFLEIEAYVPKSGFIIDFGCGHGVFSHILTKKSSLRQVIAYDTSSYKIREAKKSLMPQEKVTFSQVLQEGAVRQADSIVMLDVACYLSDSEREKLLKNLYAELKKGAMLIIKDVCRELSWKYAWVYLQELIIVKLLKLTEANQLNFYKEETFSSLLRKIGFSVQVLNLDKAYCYPHKAFICTK